MLSESYVNSIPARKLRAKHSSVLTKAPRWLDKSEQTKLLQTINTEKNIWRRFRDLAVIHTMLNGGLRVAEVSSLNLDDLDLEKEVLEIQKSKGKKYGIVPLNKDLSDALKNWFRVRRGNQKALFVSERNHRLTNRAIQHRFRKYADRINLTDVTTDCLHHSFCKNLIDTGMSLWMVAQLARHESIETTRRYTLPS